jgi:hypothetical protein
MRVKIIRVKMIRIVTIVIIARERIIVTIAIKARRMRLTADNNVRLWLY